MFPMKFFEYLAAGVPVVATDLPALNEYQHLARLCGTAHDFLAAVDEVLLARERGGSSSPCVSLDQLPECCSYQARTRAMLLELRGRFVRTDCS
jgi:glycosyltransferase involved in cell wall biosynthesis